MDNSGFGWLIAFWVLTAIISVVVLVKVPTVGSAKADQYRSTAVVLGFLPCAALSLIGQLVALGLRSAIVANRNSKQSALQGRFDSATFDEGSSPGSSSELPFGSAGRTDSVERGRSVGGSSANPFDD